MKRMLCLFVILISLSLAMAQITVDLEITDVYSVMVRGFLDIGNNTSQTIEWYFPDCATFDLMVDGQSSAVMYPQIPTSIVIEPGEVYHAVVEHHSMSPYSPGYHVAQAYMGGNPENVIGNECGFYASEIENSDYMALDYTFTLHEISASRVAGSLEMHNPTSELWTYYFPNMDIARIWIDGEPPNTGWIELFTPVSIGAGSDFSFPIDSAFAEDLSEGYHIATAHLFIEGNPQVADGIPFNIEPTEVSDQLIPMVPQLTVYPNPFTSEIALELKTSNNYPLAFCIYNLRGQKVKELCLTPQNGIAKAVWDGRDEGGKALASGVYILKSTNPLQEFSKKIIRY